MIAKLLYTITISVHPFIEAMCWFRQLLADVAVVKFAEARRRLPAAAVCDGVVKLAEARPAGAAPRLGVLDRARGDRGTPI
jgi:hypothetical protein